LTSIHPYYDLDVAAAAAERRYDQSHVAKFVAQAQGVALAIAYAAQNKANRDGDYQLALGLNQAILSRFGENNAALSAQGLTEERLNLDRNEFLSRLGSKAPPPEVTLELNNQTYQP